MGKASTKIIIALAVAFVLIAVFQVRRQQGADHGDMTAAPMFPRLDLAAVAEVQIEKAGENLVLKRGEGDHWGVEQRSGYPVDGEKLRRLALTMAQLKAQDRLTADPAKYPTLGLGDPTAQGTVRLLDVNGEVLATLQLGERKEARGPGTAPGQFVRADEDPAVYLVASAPTADTDPLAWLDRTLINVAADQVVGVAVSHGGESGNFVASRQQPTDPLTLVTPLPKGRTVDSGALGDLGRALVNLTCDDVLTAEDPSLAGLTFPAAFTATTAEGVRYTLHLAEHEGSHYLRTEASAEAPPTTVEEAGKAEDSAGEANASKADPAADVASFNARHAGWTYAIPKHTYDRLAKSLDDLLTEEK